MQVIVLRHAIALKRSEWDQDDRLRPLSDRGARECHKALQAAKPLIEPGTRLLSSPWQRAVETARIAEESWGLSVDLVDWLASEAADADERIDHLAALDYDRVVVVGHEPDLGKLVGALCGLTAIPLRKSGFAICEGPARLGGMRLEALLGSKQLRAFS